MTAPAGETLVVKETEPVYFTAEDVKAAQEKARKEEKDKLYPQLKKFEEELGEARKEREGRQAEEEKRQAMVKEAERLKAESEMSAKELIEKTNSEWRSQFAELQAEREQERAVHNKEQEFTRLREYTREQTAAAIAANEVAPELVDFVGGNNKEEIDRSLEVVKLKTNEILAGLQAASQQVRAGMRGVSTTGYAVSGPMENNSVNKTYTNEELAAMPPSEWAKVRHHFIGAGATNNRGMFG